MRAQRYFSNGVTFLVSFTWYKELTNGRSSFAPFYGPPLDNKHQGLEKALLNGQPETNDGPIVSSWSGVYELPIGPGKRYANVAGPVGKVIGGWNVSGVLAYNQGDYLTIGGGSPNPIFNGAYGDAFFGGGAPRPNKLQGVNPKAFSGGKFNPAVDYYMNPAAFADAGPFSLGTAPPVLPDARGFATYNENISLVKKTRIKESSSFEIRADFFNAFNRVQFCDPDTNINDIPSGAFGKVTGQCNTPRQIQFGVRLEF